MPCITYIEKNFRPAALRVIEQARQICQTYQDQGYDLTLRQLYYQFVARDLIPNRQSEYSRLGSIINDARLAGLLDWDFIVDRTRNLRNISHWDHPSELIKSAANSWANDRWANQPTRVEVWIEKDALVGVLDSVCPGEDVPYFSCRGYTSQSEIWGAAQRIGGYLRTGQNVTVIHLGDHDPSGVDMTRDIRERIQMFTGKDAVNYFGEVLREAIKTGAVTDPFGSTDDEYREWSKDQAMPLIDPINDGFGVFHINRIALNMDQVDDYNPPPNPAKLTDSRATGYIDEYGDSSWELDALEPNVLADLITEAIEEERVPELWEAATERQEHARGLLKLAARRWEEVEAFLSRNG